jgi:hypothetical protein
VDVDQDHVVRQGLQIAGTDVTVGTVPLHDSGFEGRVMRSAGGRSISRSISSSNSGAVRVVQHLLAEAHQVVPVQLGRTRLGVRSAASGKQSLYDTTDKHYN